MAKPKKKANTSKPSLEQLLSIDPRRIRYQHSRIRPHFSGCGRSVLSTLESIRSGDVKVEDLPPIQVLVGPSDGDGTWYFSLNNRRLWVLKQLREEGFLETVQCRVRKPKSQAEKTRYTLENCSVDAKFIREKAVTSTGHSDDVESGNHALSGSNGDETQQEMANEQDLVRQVQEKVVENESDSESDDDVAHANPFSALMG